jgi:hypothetical protein
VQIRVAPESPSDLGCARPEIRAHHPVPADLNIVSTDCRLQICGHRKKTIQKPFCKAREQPKRHTLPDRQATHDDLQETAAYL